MSQLTTQDASQSLPSFGRMNGLQQRKYENAVYQWKWHFYTKIYKIYEELQWEFTLTLCGCGQIYSASYSRGLIRPSYLATMQSSNIDGL